MANIVVTRSFYIMEKDWRSIILAIAAFVVIIIDKTGGNFNLGFIILALFFIPSYVNLKYIR